MEKSNKALVAYNEMKKENLSRLCQNRKGDIMEKAREVVSTQKVTLAEKYR